MDETRLKQLLTRADAGPAVLTDPAAMTGGVLRRRARRTRVRRASVSLLAVACLATGISQLSRWQSSTPPPLAETPRVARPPTTPTFDRSEVDRLAREAATWLAIARRADAADRLARANATAARLHAAIGLERERAATVMLHQGDWRRTRGQSGADEYRRAAELFDGTRAAAEARARLGQG